ncbi:MAG: hypothetical protein TYPL_4980 [Candidatus Tyloplasma litorale]|nr:MAG: hypothetical protein TYPL_4980 [Mycoplasmatales bacterium]
MENNKENLNNFIKDNAIVEENSKIRKWFLNLGKIRSEIGKLNEKIVSIESNIEKITSKINDQKNFDEPNEKNLSNLTKQKKLKIEELKKIKRRNILLEKKDNNLISQISNNSGNKINRARYLTKRFWKLEDQYIKIEQKSTLVNEKLDKYSQEFEELRKKKDSLSIKLGNEKKPKIQKELQNKINKLKKLISKKLFISKRWESKIKSLEFKKELLIVKVRDARYKSDLAVEIAHIANDAFVKTKGEEILRLQNKLSNLNYKLDYEEREYLAKEISKLKLEEKRTNIIDEEKERKKLIISKNVGIIENLIKNIFKRTYWIILERGASTRDFEFKDFIKEQHEEKLKIISEIKVNHQRLLEKKLSKIDELIELAKKSNEQIGSGLQKEIKNWKPDEFNLTKIFADTEKEILKEIDSAKQIIEREKELLEAVK